MGKVGVVRSDLMPLPGEALQLPPHQSILNGKLDLPLRCQFVKKYSVFLSHCLFPGIVLPTDNCILYESRV